MSYRLAVTRQTVSKWELGITAPDADKIDVMCELFGVSADELLYDRKPFDKIKVSGSRDTEIPKKTKHIGVLLIFLIALLFIFACVTGISGIIAFAPKENAVETVRNFEFWTSPLEIFVIGSAVSGVLIIAITVIAVKKRRKGKTKNKKWRK